MKTLLLTDFYSDFFGNLQLQLFFMYVENIFLFMLISTAVLFIVAAPVVLFYTSIDNYFKWKSSKSLITNEICCQNSVNHPTYIKQVCNQYKNSFSGLVGSITGLFAWNIGSLLYILTAFPNFKNGIKEYFLFPFDVVISYDSTNMIASINQYNSNWLFMILIFTTTVLFYQFGKTLAILKIENKFVKGVKNISWT